MEVAERIRTRGTTLTTAERRVAEAILAAPDGVAFGTVADLAAAADVGAATVVRLAAKLGFDGFTDLQTSIQRELADQLRPAVERIHHPGAGGRSDHLVAELANVRTTVDGVADDELDAMVARLAAPDRPVAVLSGEASMGVARQFVFQIEQLRPDVQVLAGSDVAVRRDIALLPPTASALVIDLRRYERWVLDAHGLLADRGIWSAGFTDSVLSPIAARADVTVLVAAASAGPFDSHVGTLAVLDLIVVRVAAKLRTSAVDRLAAVEQAWRDGEALIDPGDGGRPGAPAGRRR